MEEIIIEKLKSILDELKNVDENFIKDEISSHYIEFLEEGNQISILAANTEGFVYLAKCMISLAVNRIDGKHLHFDSSTMLDRNERDLIIKYRKAPWDK